MHFVRRAHTLAGANYQGSSNEGRYVIGVNASIYLKKRYFQDENVLVFNVDGSGAPGTQWVERRTGLVRPRLSWKIEKQNKEYEQRKN